jgi:hypothetical protein
MTEQSFDLWIEAEEWPADEWTPADAVTDVVLTLSDGTRWVATFCAFAHLDTLRAACRATGENLSGKYLWASDLILVDDTSRESVRTVVADLVAAGDVPSAFSELTDPDVASGGNGESRLPVQ